jgi:hypothetical protein
VPDAQAQPHSNPDTALRRPAAPRLVHVPTAYVLPSAGLYGSAGGSHRGAGFGALSIGLGGVAEVGVSTDDDAGECVDCDAGAVARALSVRSAYFKMGVAEGAFHRLQPALALGFQAQLGAPESEELRAIRLARLYLVASRTVGSVRAHLGMDLWDGRGTGSAPVSLNQQDLSRRVRPFAGLGLTPRIYPRTTLLGEVSWVPTFGSASVDLRWLAGWGVRYQAFSWSSVELVVRHRARGTLDDSTVLIRANWGWSPQQPRRW